MLRSLEKKLKLMLILSGECVEKSVKIKILNERGIILLNVVFLTLIVSFAAMIFLNGAAKINNSNSALRLIALNLSNEQFAELENLAASGNLQIGGYSFLGAADDLKNYNVNENFPVEFSVTSTVENYLGYENLRLAKVKVSWNFDGKNYELENEKILRVKFSDLPP